MYPRGALARVIYEKFHVDKQLDENFDTRLWYSLSPKHDIPHEFQHKFLPLLRPDETTLNWLAKAKELSANIWVHIWHLIARSFLKFFMTQTNINGLLRRGSMFILSEEQFERLLRAGGVKHFTNGQISMLDVGAGDGEISTRLLQSLKRIQQHDCVHIFATETSCIMKKRLNERKINVINQIEDICDVQLISCLNVLDRCVDPFELLESIHRALAPDGRVLIALVLPYVHYVEFNRTHMPLRPLFPHWPERAKKYTFEAEATMFFRILENCGFNIESWTKAPYLCEGDLRQSFYWLIDLVVVVSKKNT